MSGAGYNDKGEIHIHKCDSVDKARESIYRLLEVSYFSLKSTTFDSFLKAIDVCVFLNDCSFKTATKYCAVNL